MLNPTRPVIRWLIKPVVFSLSLIPFALLFYGAFTDQLGANPVEAITHETGIWGLYFLLITLTVTPLRRLLGMPWLVNLRRMLGLFAFFYASLHVLTYLWLDQYFLFSAIIDDIVKRPYITVGFAAWLLLLPLALTSTRFAVRRLGRHWKRLHSLVYPSVALVLLHFLWLIKADTTEPMLYLLLFLLLMLARTRLLGAYQATAAGQG